ncbi:MAG: deoxyribonuclease IV [Phycisphaerales bacterium]|nr:deoxyribonuclease IV [Phycisphaerales bacterium]
MLGSHLSISGGMVKALEEAERLGMDCVQVFTKNQRRWSVPPLSEEDRSAWLAQLKRLGWDDPAELRTVSHNSYLINMASPDPEGRAKSIALQREELRRCEALSIPLLVAHPGAHLGAARPRGDRNRLGEPPSSDELAGLERIISALDELHAETAGYGVRTCLETTVGSGTNLGYDFQHLKIIREGVAAPERVGFCLDTCHITAAGYDLATDAAAAEVIETFDGTCGLDNLLSLHLNDSQGALGSRLDRHAHIGDGCCGDACFRAFLSHPTLISRPMILETAKEEAPDGRNWDEVNLDRLRALCPEGTMSR